MKSEVENYADFSRILYSQCWEDADILLEALKVKKNGTYVSIASAGDNSFALLSKSPRKVTAIDVNEQQLYCVELKREAYRLLDYNDFMNLAGFRNDKNRICIFDKVKKSLSKECRIFWDEHMKLIEKGYYHIGRLEQYFHVFSKKWLPLAHSHRVVEEFFKNRTMDEQRRFYYERWDTFRWRMVTKHFFSEKVMEKLGRDKAFFRYVDIDVAKQVMERFERGLLQVPLWNNPYIHYLMLGTFREDAMPYALKEENFLAIKKNINRLELQKVCLEEYLDTIGEHTIDGFNLSDIFEYMSPENVEQVYSRILHAAKKDARVVYRNMLVDRMCPAVFQDKAEIDRKEFRRLTLKDKTCFYKHFTVEVIKNV